MKNDNIAGYKVIAMIVIVICLIPYVGPEWASVLWFPIMIVLIALPPYGDD